MTLMYEKHAIVVHSLSCLLRVYYLLFRPSLEIDIYIEIINYAIREANNPYILYIYV